MTPKVKTLKRKRELNGRYSTPRSVKENSSKEESRSEVKHYALRQRMKQELSNLKNLTGDSDPEESDGDYSCDDNDSEDDKVINNGKTPGKKNNKDMCAFAESYFFAQKQSKSTNMTSNRTLSKVKLEQMNIKELSEICKNAPEYHQEEKELLFKEYTVLFPKWEFLLQESFNILLYGVGSKQKILNAFSEKYLEDNLYIVVHGFFPSLNLKQILSSVTEDILEHDGKFSTVQDQAEFVKEYFSGSKEHLYIVIHNIDGIALRAVKTQRVLSSLASIPNIHFLCSIDHINSPLIWDQIMLNKFKWIWYEVPTFEPYIIETSYESSFLKDQSTHLLLSSLLHVYRSLTPNGQGVFLILAQHQRNEQKNNSYSGITFHEWYQECREAFLANSEITMQAQISEFKNHKLLASRKSPDGVELWYIPVEQNTLIQFLESCE
ncbi:origin recognition complex subunit 2-like [Stegodyphus dumicola]|uniref:origin recognition complex subunit 2-like n=1 Tax=Stegodyphus dumicola TaxID=202533 RepID=UPI0015A9135D|nr:origin recognition complex subunit 2-like [Stegodyphus dumicola]